MYTILLVIAKPKKIKIVKKVVRKSELFYLDGLSNQHSCGDSTPIAIGFALSVVIVLVGSVINFIYWRRKTGTSKNLNLR